MSARLTVLSILDAPVITGPARGLIQLSRSLPPEVRLHVAMLRGRDAGPLPRLDEASGGALTQHEVHERGSFHPHIVVDVARVASRIGAGVIQSHSYKPHLIALAVRVARRAPWVGHHHGWTAENDKVKRYHQIDGLTLPRANRVVAVAGSARDIVIREGCDPAKVEVIPNAVDRRDIDTTLTRDEARDALKIPRDAFVACVVGRLSHEKGQDVALEALARVRDRNVPLVMALAGDGPDRAKLEALVASRDLGARVIFLGHQKQVGVVYRASDMMVMPSRSEAMPNALLESQTLGVPVVATRVGGVPEVATHGETAWIVPSDDAPALADAIVECATGPDERARRVSLGAARMAAHHDPARRAERYLALWRSLR